MHDDRRLTEHEQRTPLTVTWRRDAARRAAGAEDGRAARGSSQAIAEARAHGDLSENAEYDGGARSSRASSKAASPSSKASLSNAQIIDPALLDADGRCVFGATVELEDMDSGEIVTYQIVGEDEADIKQGKISITSPIARALIGKRAGDVAEVQAPGGVASTRS